MIAGQHSRLLSEPDPGVEVSVVNTSGQADGTFLQSLVSGTFTVLPSHTASWNWSLFQTFKMQTVLFSSQTLQAVSPDGEAIVTGAGDETLRFWSIFSKTRCTKVGGTAQSLGCVSMDTHKVMCFR